MFVSSPTECELLCPVRESIPFSEILCFKELKMMGSVQNSNVCVIPHYQKCLDLTYCINGY